jgi:hypothetical protein
MLRNESAEFHSRVLRGIAGYRAARKFKINSKINGKSNSLSRITRTGPDYADRSVCR